MSEFRLQVSYKDDRTVDLTAESLSEAIQAGLRLLGPDQGRIQIFEKLISVGVPRIEKSVLRTEITSRMEEVSDKSVGDAFNVKLAGYLDDLEYAVGQKKFLRAADLYQQVGELLHNAQIL